MLRRTAIASFAAAATAGIAGCVGDDAGDGETSTPTSTNTSPTPSPTDTGGGASVQYTVRNDDDETHPLEVVIENGAGEVVHSETDAEFAPGEQLGATSSGHDPTEGPYPITVGLGSLAQTVEWKADECPEFDLLVAVTADGHLEVEREACLK